jgi:hypothetical protein
MNHSPVIGSIGPASANDELNNNVEIIVHINETLDGVTRNGLQAAILEDKGVFSAEFCPLSPASRPIRPDETQFPGRTLEGGGAESLRPDRGSDLTDDRRLIPVTACPRIPIPG